MSESDRKRIRKISAERRAIRRLQKKGMLDAFHAPAPRPPLQIEMPWPLPRETAKPKD